jgi:hypothetical protein
VLEERLRNLPPVLGISLGVVLSIGATSMNSALKADFEERLRWLGSRTFYVVSPGGDLPAAIPSFLRSRWPDLILSAVREIPAEKREQSGGLLPAVLLVDENFHAALDGLRLKGRALSSTDFRFGRPVCLVGSGSVKGLEEGRLIAFGGLVLQAVGILDEAGSTGQRSEVGLPAFGGSIVVPSTLTGPVAGDVGDQVLIVKVPENRSYSRIVNEVAVTLPRLTTSELRIKLPEESIRTESTARRHLVATSAIVAVVTLTLGSLVLASSMLSNLGHRLPELGIRIGLGATSRDLRAQLIAESVVLSFGSALIGFCGGAVALAVVRRFGWWEVGLDWISAAVSLVACLALGLTVGLIPARRVANLAPRDCDLL